MPLRGSNQFVVAEQLASVLSAQPAPEPSDDELDGDDDPLLPLLPLLPLPPPSPPPLPPPSPPPLPPPLACAWASVVTAGIL